MNEFTEQKSTYGVGEWAGWSYNIGTGCINNCLYCYARCSALKNNQILSAAAWTTEKPKAYKIDIRQHVNERVMFPSMHDITQNYLDTFCMALRNIIKWNNTVLIVSKPRIECIERICSEFAEFNRQIEFRFSIGSLDLDVAAFWEPGAPSPQERIQCLEYAVARGFVASVSMEPILGSREDAIEDFGLMAPLTNGTIWIGTMNKIDERVDISSVEIGNAVALVSMQQEPEEMIGLYHYLKNEPKIRWKESIRDLIK